MGFGARRAAFTNRPGGGLVLLTWWILIIPVIVLEGTRAGEAFSRSRELVRGHGWSVFGVIELPDYRRQPLTIAAHLQEPVSRATRT